MKKILKNLSISILFIVMMLCFVVPTSLSIKAQSGEGVTSCTFWASGPWKSEAQCESTMREALAKSQTFINARNKCLAKMGSGAFFGSFAGPGGTLLGVSAAGVDCLIDLMP